MIQVYVMQTCPDCTQVKEKLADDTRFEIIDLGVHVRHLKKFLALRDSHPAFREIRERGLIGIPCFVFEDGSISFDPESVAVQLTQDGASCSLDGKGC